MKNIILKESISIKYNFSGIVKDAIMTGSAVIKDETVMDSAAGIDKNILVKWQKKCRICDNIASPFILGIFRPMIYLPGSLTPEQMQQVLAHETAHLKRKDHWWKPLGFAILTLHWFNPLVWLAYVLLCRDIEMACDEKVVRTMETEEKRSYSKTLLDQFDNNLYHQDQHYSTPHIFCYDTASLQSINMQKSVPKHVDTDVWRMGSEQKYHLY